jgi:hypothetical protein
MPWRLWARNSYSVDLEIVRRRGSCPSKFGLYQVMRNRVLADELRRRTNAAWAHFAVCCHPENHSVFILDEPVGKMTNALAAFRSLSTLEAVFEWDAALVMDFVTSKCDSKSEWQQWMQARYFAN